MGPSHGSEWTPTAVSGVIPSTPKRVRLSCGAPAAPAGSVAAFQVASEK